MDNNRNRDYRDRNYRDQENNFEGKNRHDSDGRLSSNNSQNKNYGSPNSGWNDNYRENNYGSNSSYQGNQNYNRNQDRNLGLGDTSQGSANYGHRDNSGGSRYYGTGNLGGYYKGNDRNSQGKNAHNQNDDRDWWDRTSDEVASWFGDEDAERRRNRDKMEGPNKGKGPKGYVRSDEKIQDEVNDKLYHDSYVDASDIEVTVTDGEVTLTGTVNDKNTKRRAEDLAEDITGVHDVTNNLKVNRSTTTNLSINRADNESTMI